ncbi:MAG: hypothetical protein KIT81_09180 [Alphaproteobacteria bacterium]|nr:hypothetical protein [Alphaproteobacteria bacterium]
MLVMGGMVLLSLAFWGASYLTLVLTRETLRPSEAAEIVAREGGRYGSVLRYRPYPFKLAMLEREKPEIVVLGSSRVMMFRQEFFSRPMLNFGGAVKSVETLDAVVSRLRERGRPSLAIVGVDYWWFNVRRDDDDALDDIADSANLTLKDLVQPAVWLWERKLRMADLTDLLKSLGEAPLGVGFAAKFLGAGFQKDGSYIYGATTHGATPSPDPQFRRTLRRSTGPKSKFTLDFTFSEEEFHELSTAMRKLGELAGQVIVLLPPVAEPVLTNHMPEARRGLDRLIELIRAEGWPLAEYTDPTRYGSDACEFIDGMHGGVVTYARLSLDMARSDPSLGRYFDMARLEAMVRERAGFATLAEDHPPGRRETDFLKLGCVKE